MIRIHKPTAPTKLIQDGSKKAEAHLQDYLQDPIAYQTGKKRFNFGAKIYAHPSVKTALIKSQHKKCCFCERLIGKDGDIEHFRPKSAYRQKSTDQLQYPGYYWLAYDWDNLYLSCGPCNQRSKKNFFGISNPKKRAQLNDNNTALETPVLIDPGHDDPSDHIIFRGEIPVPQSGSEKGKATIEIIKLDRTILNDARLIHLMKMKVIYEAIQIAKNKPNNLELKTLTDQLDQVLQDSMLDNAEFAAATRNAFNDGFRFVI